MTDSGQQLLVLVPSRGRPRSVVRMVQAWQDTRAYEHARLVFVVDGDDPLISHYRQPAAAGPELVSLAVVDQWMPMVHKLNQAAFFAADDATVHGATSWFAIGFLGDDHLPRTRGWAGRVVDQLHELGTGIVYGDDLLQGRRLPTHWAMTSDIIRALGRMVPADVEHLYCDNAIGDLGAAAGCIRYLPDVVIEHMHPLAGKAVADDGYRVVNSAAQYRRDEAAYRTWVAGQLASDADKIRALRKG